MGTSVEVTEDRPLDQSVEAPDPCDARMEQLKMAYATQKQLLHEDHENCEKNVRLLIAQVNDTVKKLKNANLNMLRAQKITYKLTRDTSDMPEMGDYNTAGQSIFEGAPQFLGGRGVQSSQSGRGKRRLKLKKTKRKKTKRKKTKRKKTKRKKTN